MSTGWWRRGGERGGPTEGALRTGASSRVNTHALLEWFLSLVNTPKHNKRTTKKPNHSEPPKKFKRPQTACTKQQAMPFSCFDKQLSFTTPQQPAQAPLSAQQQQKQHHNSSQGRRPSTVALQQPAAAQTSHTPSPTTPDPWHIVDRAVAHRHRHSSWAGTTVVVSTRSLAVPDRPARSSSNNTGPSPYHGAIPPGPL